MSERDKVEEFISYGINDKITLKECIKNELLIILLSLPSIIIGETYNISGIFGLLPIVLYPIFAVKLKNGKTIEGIYCILHNGVISLCISFIFAWIGIEIVLNSFQRKFWIIVICIVITGYILAGLLYKFLFVRMVTKRHFNKRKSRVKISASVGAILGYCLARTFLKDMDTRKALVLVCILCFSLSYLTLIGIINIFRFQCLEKQNKSDDGKSTQDKNDSDGQ